MKKLYRSRRDSKLFGLCGGLAEMLNVDATLLRLVVVVTAFFSGGTVVLLYVLASLVIPKEPVFDPPFTHHQPHTPPFGGHGGFGGSHSHGQPFHHQTTQPSQTAKPVDNLDEMMKDIEKKALQKELEELKAKLAKYEKGE